MIGQRRENYPALAEHVLAVCLYSVQRVECHRLRKNEHGVGWMLHTANKIRDEGPYPSRLLKTRKSVNTTVSFLSVIL
jgi:hypothetical protein